MRSRTESESRYLDKFGGGITPAQMLDNAACAAQVQELIDNPVLRGAILRSVAQWITTNAYPPAAALHEQLTRDPDFDR